MSESILNPHGVDARITPPPTDRKILVQIINDYGKSDLNWYEVWFDDTIKDKSNLNIYNDQDEFVGKVWFWKDIQ